MGYGIVELYGSPEKLSPVFCDAPTPCARDLGHQMANVEPFPQASHGGTGPPSLAPLRRPSEEWFADLGVTAAPRDVVTLQDRPEEPHVVRPRRLEPCVAAVVDHRGLGQVPEVLVGRGRVVHHRQRVPGAAWVADSA